MIVLEIEQIEVDHCVRCKGTWLDAGELELLLDGADNKDRLLSSMDSDAAVREAPRRCPICAKKMQKVLYGCDGADRVLVDKCTRNDGLWFDEGELTGIMDMGDFPCEHKIYELLNDVFGNKESSDR
jgi:Zn-finger nucleic acid-binding protein